MYIRPRLQVSSTSRSRHFSEDMERSTSRSVENEKPIRMTSISIENDPQDEGDGIRPRCPVPSTRGVLPKGFFLPPPDTTHEQHEWNKQTETQGSWEDMVDAVESGKPGKVEACYSYDWPKWCSERLWHPMMHAAENGDYNICKKLMELSATAHKDTSKLMEIDPEVNFNHGYLCECSLNTSDTLKHAMFRVNAYSTISSPQYLLCLQDPVKKALTLRKAMKDMLQQEAEFKEKYEQSCHLCEEFVCDFIGMCDGETDLTAVLCEKVNQNKTVLDFAKAQKAKRFITTPYIQRHLSDKFYGQSRWLRKLLWRNNILKALMIAVCFPLLTFLHIMYIFFGVVKKKFCEQILSEFLQTPVIKFYSHALAHISFLFLLLFGAMVDRERHAMTTRPTNINVLQVLILWYVFGFLLIEIKQVYKKKERYFYSWFNWMDLSLISLYFVSFGFGFAAMKNAIYAHDYVAKYVNLTANHTIPPRIFKWYTANRLYWDAYDPQTLADSLFAMANVITFARLYYILPCFESLGHLLVTLGRMLNDVFRFLSLLLIVFTAFSVGLHNLYWSYGNVLLPNGEMANEDFDGFFKTALTLLWSIFGMGSADSIKLGVNHPAPQFMGFLLFTTFHVLIVVMLINMLIAMMTTSFESIQEHCDTEWKFARTNLWLQYIQRGQTIPVPLNTILSVKWVIKIILYCWKYVLCCANEEIRSDNHNTCNRNTTVKDENYKVHVVGIVDLLT